MDYVAQAPRAAFFLSRAQESSPCSRPGFQRIRLPAAAPGPGLRCAWRSRRCWDRHSLRRRPWPPRPASPPRGPFRGAAAARERSLFHGRGGESQDQPLRHRRRGIQIRLLLRSLRQHGRSRTQRPGGRAGRAAGELQAAGFDPSVSDHLLQRKAGGLQSDRHARPIGLCQ